MSEKIIIEYDLPESSVNVNGNDLYSARMSVAEASMVANKFDSEVTILIQGYNRIEKTKQCVESVLKYTGNVNYDLLLVDNGSTDDTFEYFKSIPYDKVRIIRVNRNINSAFPWNLIRMDYISKYLVVLANDLIVTTNWLSNMLRIAKSDPLIGMVNPISSNTSNLQSYDFEFKDIDDMQRKAAEINVSDPAKWHERLRLITLGTLFTKECLYAVGIPLGDMGFIHDFGDDDITFRVRRAGYKTILAKDTWIHHNHDLKRLENKDPIKFQQSLDIGRENFKNKFFGVDAWDDVNNYVPNIVAKVLPPSDFDNCCILGMDVRCGTPILEIKNKLREYEIYDPICCAFTSEGKYFIDLQTVCGADNVFSCSPENAFGYFPSESFDYIVIGNNINEYPEPFKVIKTAFALLKRGGRMFFNLKNAFNIYSFINIIGYRGVYPDIFAYNISCEAFIKTLNDMGITAFINGYAPITDLQPELVKLVEQRIPMFNKEGRDETKIRLTADTFSFYTDK